MKNFNRFLIAAVALISGFAMSACTPDDIDDKKPGKTTVAVSVGDMTATGLGITQISLATADEANGSLATIDEALKTLNKQRADLGAYQNRFEVAQKGVAIAAENLQAAESVIRDADMANEMVNFTRDNILVQAGSAMLAQANTKTQSVMRLLG